MCRSAFYSPPVLPSYRRHVQYFLIDPSMNGPYAGTAPRICAAASGLTDPPRGRYWLTMLSRSFAFLKSSQDLEVLSPSVRVPNVWNAETAVKNAAFALGLIWREQPWRWVVIMLGTQAAWSFLLALVASGVPNLFPLGLVMFALLGLPCLGMAYAGKWLGDRVLG